MGSPTNQHESDTDGADGRGVARLAPIQTVGALAGQPASDTGGRVLPDDLKAALEDAQLLLAYAADAGVDIPVDVRGKVLAARRAADGAWTDQNALELLESLTTLSAKLKPVSGESLRVCAVDKQASKTIFRLRLVAIGLTLIIAPFSVVAFVAAATCESIHQQIDLANGLAVTLARLPHPAPDPAAGLSVEAGADVRQYPENEVKQLVEFAGTIRDIDRKALELKRLIFLPGYKDNLASWHSDPVRFKARFELASANLNVEREVSEKIDLYQDVRAFAQNVQEMVQISFGAVTSCVLPMLYALLGASAFLIRSFSEQRRKRTFTRHGQRPARLLIAAICGLVIGLFGNFGDGHTVGLSPLAVAFMVGYAVDLFFLYIDGLLRALARRPSADTPARGATTPS
jgi:hypothetical protein